MSYSPMTPPLTRSQRTHTIDLTDHTSPVPRLVERTDTPASTPATDLYARTSPSQHAYASMQDDICDLIDEMDPVVVARIYAEVYG